MKNLAFIFGLCCLLANPVAAQFTSGGKKKNKTQTPQEPQEQTEPEGIFENHNVTVKVALINPTGSFGDEASNTTWIEQYDGTDGFGAQIGLAFGFSTYSYFNTSNTTSKVGVIQDVNWSIIPLDWSTIGSGWYSDDVDNFILIDYGVGVNYTYNLNDKALFDAGVLIYPTLGLSPIMTNRRWEAEMETFYVTRYGFRFGIRTGGLVIGLNFIGGTAGYDTYIYDNDNFNGFTVTSDLPMSTTNLSVGFAF